MSWQLILLFLMGSFLGLIFLGVPIVYALFTVDIVGAFALMGGLAGLEQVVLSSYSSLSVFVLLPITLFILMGEIMFRTGIAKNMLDTVETWLGKVPGRMSLVAVGAGTLFAALSGASIGSTAMLGSSLLPEMEEKGYDKSMSVGPIMGSGGLSILIPPSGLGVILAVVAKISVGDLLLAIIIPGIILATFYVLYIVGRCAINPSLAPAYDVEHTPLAERLLLTLKYVVPLGFIIFLVVGVIYLGVGTPTEAAALGAIGSYILAIIYNKKVDLKILKESVESTLKISIMVLTVLVGGEIFSQLLAYSGATHELVRWAMTLSLPSVVIIILMCLLTLFLGMFINGAPLIMITVPIFMPVIIGLGYDPLWFAVIMLINVEVAQITPPYGLLLYVMKGVAPESTTMQDIMKSSIPYIILPFVLIALLIVFPNIVTVLIR